MRDGLINETDLRAALHAEAAGFAAAAGNFSDLERRIGGGRAGDGRAGDGREPKNPKGRRRTVALVSAAAVLLAACATGVAMAKQIWWMEQRPDGAWEAVAKEPAAIVAEHPEMEFTLSMGGTTTLDDAALSAKIGVKVRFPAQLGGWQLKRKSISAIMSTTMGESTLVPGNDELWHQALAAARDDAMFARLKHQGRDIWRSTSVTHGQRHLELVVIAIARPLYRDPGLEVVTQTIDLGGGLKAEWYEGQFTREPGYDIGEAEVPDEKHKPYRAQLRELYWDLGQATFLLLAPEGTPLSAADAAAFAREFIAAQ